MKYFFYFRSEFATRMDNFHSACLASFSGNIFINNIVGICSYKLVFVRISTHAFWKKKMVW